MPQRPVLAPIARAWISTGHTGAQNYDEFASDPEITEVIAANPASALAIEMPHRTPESVALGRSFAESLDAAAASVRALQDDGHFVAAQNVVALYRISGHDGTAYGLFCMADTAQISTSAAEPGTIIRNEEVFAEKVRERTMLTRRLGMLLSPVLLLQTAHGEELHAALADTAERSGEPAVTDVDPQGRTHAIWVLSDTDSLLELAGAGDLVVADGNHRSLSAQQAGLDRFLAVVTTPASVRIAPYNRLVSADVVPERLGGIGSGEAPRGGTVVIRTRDGSYAVRLSTMEGATADGDIAERLDHAVVERVIFGEHLGLDAEDPRIRYVGGDYDESWLAREVDEGRADAAILIAPVTVEDFVAVNLARRQMPRKSTWFTPKARAGLVLAEVDQTTMR